MSRFACLTLLFAGLLFTGNAAFGQQEKLSAQDEALIAKAVVDSEKSIETAFTGHDVGRQIAAVRMMRFLGPAKAFDRIYALIRDFPPSDFKSVKPDLRYEALATLFYLDPERTLRLLLEYNDAVLASFDPALLFSIIGYDKITRFNNLFYYCISGNPGQSRIAPYLLAEWFLKTRDEKYGRFLRFIGLDPTASSEEVLAFYNYSKERNLPLKKIIFYMKDRAGILAAHPMRERTFSLDELLFQALLYRLGVTKEVYRKTIQYENHFGLTDERASRKYGVGLVEITESRDLSQFSMFPDFLMNDAVAYFYAGVPEQRHLDAFMANYDRMSELMRVRYAAVIAASPDNNLKDSLADWIISRREGEPRRIMLASRLRKISALTNEIIQALLSMAPDVLSRSMIYEKIADSGNRKLALILIDSLEKETDPFVRITIAGGILELAGTRK
jgi:hypothetical protein